MSRVQHIKRSRNKANNKRNQNTKHHRKQLNTPTNPKKITSEILRTTSAVTQYIKAKFSKFRMMAKINSGIVMAKQLSTRGQCDCTSAQQQPVAMQIKSETGWAHRHTMTSHVVSRCPIDSRQSNGEVLRAVCIRHPRMIFPLYCSFQAISFRAISPTAMAVPHRGLSLLPFKLE